MFRLDAKLLAIGALGSGVFAAINLLIAAWVGSAALMANAVHGLANATSQAAMHRGVRLGQHPGRDEAIYFWSYVVTILMFSLAAGVAIAQGAERLRSPSAILPATIALLAVGAAFVFQLSWRVVLHRARAVPFGSMERSSPVHPTIANLVGLQNGAAIFSGLVSLASLVAAAQGNSGTLDAVASIGIGLITGLVAARTAVAFKAELSANSISLATGEPDGETRIEDRRASDDDAGRPAESPRQPSVAPAVTATSTPASGQHLSRKQKKRRR